MCKSSVPKITAVGYIHYNFTLAVGRKEPLQICIIEEKSTLSSALMAIDIFCSVCSKFSIFLYDCDLNLYKNRGENWESG